MISLHTAQTSLEEQKKKQTSKKLRDYGSRTLPLPDSSLKVTIMQRLKSRSKEVQHETKTKRLLLHMLRKRTQIQQMQKCKWRNMES